MSQPAPPLNVFDLGGRDLYLRARAPEKLWIMEFLFALRDGQGRVILRAEDDNVRVWLEDAMNSRDLVAPKPILVGPMFEVIWRLSLAKKLGPLEVLGIDEIIRPKEVPDTWSCRFRLKLDEGLKDVYRHRDQIRSRTILVLELADVTIGPGAASDRLAELVALGDEAKEMRR